MFGQLSGSRALVQGIKVWIIGLSLELHPTARTVISFAQFVLSFAQFVIFFAQFVLFTETVPLLAIWRKNKQYVTMLLLSSVVWIRIQIGSYSAALRIQIRILITDPDPHY